MAPTRSKPHQERPDIGQVGGSKIKPGELKDIVEEILQDLLQQQQRIETKRDGQLQELYGMLLRARSGIESNSDGLLGFEEEVLEDESGWKKYRSEHSLTSGKPTKKISLPKLPTIKFDLQPISLPSPIPIASRLQDPDVSLPASPPAPSTTVPALSPIDVDVPMKSATPEQSTINPALLLLPSTQSFPPVPLSSLPFRPTPRLYRPSLFTSSSHGPSSPVSKGAGPEYHPYLYPPAASGSVYKRPGPVTPPGGTNLELEQISDAPTPEETSYQPLSLEGPYARSLHPLPDTLPLHKPSKRQRQSSDNSRGRQVSGSGYGHGPHMATSVQVLANQPNVAQGSRDTRSSSPPETGVIGAEGKGEKGKMDLYRLAVGFKENPVSGMVNRGNKCVTSREWRTAWQEVKFLRTIERIDTLKQAETWSFRQPKKFRGPVIPKSHWDFLLDEMRWMQADFKEERRWKIAAAWEVARACRRWHKAGEEKRARMSVGGRYWGKRGEEGLGKGKGKGKQAVGIEEDGMDLDQELEDPEAGMSPAVDEVMKDNEMMEEEEEMAEIPEVTDAEVSKTLKGKEKERVEKEKAAAKGKGKAEAEEDEEEEEEEDADGEAEDAEGEADDADGEAEEEEDVQMEDAAEQPGDVSGEIDVEEPIQTRALQLGSNSFQTLGVHAPEPSPRSFNILTKEVRQPLLSASPSQFLFSLPSLLPPSTPAELIPADMGLQELFPDLAIYSGLTVPTEGKVEKRTDESMQGAGRLTHTTRLMDLRPVLISTLQPGKNRSLSGTWNDLDDGSMFEDYEGEGMSLQQPPPAIFAPKHSARRPHNKDLGERRDPLKPRHADARAAILEWEEPEDNLLRELADDYALNWDLISDIFNSSRVTISTDLRSPWDCFNRWNTRWGPASLESAAPATGEPSSAQGVEKAMSQPPSAVSAAGPSTALGGSVEPGSAQGVDGGPPSPNTLKRDAKAAKLTKFEGSRKKVRNTCLKDAMRRIQKRRDLSKKPRDPRGVATVLNVHESHNQYLSNRIAPTPQELSHAQHEQVVMQQEQMRMEHHRRTQMRLLQNQQQQAGRMQQMQLQQAQAQQANVALQQQQPQQGQQLPQQQQMAPRLQQNGIPMQQIPNQPLQGTPNQIPIGLPNQANVIQGPPRPLTAQGGGNMQQQQQQPQQQMAQQQLTQAMMVQAQQQQQQQQGRPLQNMPVGNRMPMQVINGQVVNGQPQQGRPMNMQGGQMNQAQLNQAALQAQGMAQALQGGGMQQQQQRNVSSPASSHAGLQGSPQLQSGQTLARPSSAASQSRPNGSSASPQLNNRPTSSQGGGNPAINSALLASMLGRMGNSNGPFQIGGQTIPAEQFRAIQLQLMQQMQQQQAANGGHQGNVVGNGNQQPNPQQQMILQQQLQQAQQHAAQQMQQAHNQQSGNLQNQAPGNGS